MLEDLNVRVGYEEVHAVMGKYGVPGRNVIGDILLEMCAEMELVVENTFFRMNGINKFTWQRIENGRLVESNDGLCVSGKECSGKVGGCACSNGGSRRNV